MHAIADALVAHLASAHEASVADALDDARGWFGDGPVVLRAVRVDAALQDTAPLVIAWTDYPGILVRAGAAHGGIYPVCGCEACDEPWESVADDLEEPVLAVADGRLQESTTRGIEYVIEDADGAARSSGWASSADARDGARRRVGRDLLAAREGGRWLPWPVRAAGNETAR